MYRAGELSIVYCNAAVASSIFHGLGVIEHAHFQEDTHAYLTPDGQAQALRNLFARLHDCAARPSSNLAVLCFNNCLPCAPKLGCRTQLAHFNVCMTREEYAESSFAYLLL